MEDSRWKAIAEKYQRDIKAGLLKPGERLPSDAALAHSLGVSRATAHRALAELKRWGLVARQRGSGTVVSTHAQRQKGVVAFIVDQVSHQRDFPRPDLVGGIHEGLGEDRTLLWCDSKLSPAREIAYLRQMAEEADGIICWPTGSPETSEVLAELSAAGTPIVLLDRVPAGVQIDAVTNDSATSTRHALEFLIERGHRQIAFFSFNKPGVSTVQERVETFEQVFQDRGWPSGHLVRLFSPDLEFGDSNRFLQTVHDAFFTLVKAADPVTAVFCVQDMFAAGVIESAEHLGIAVPDQVEIATYNDWPSMMLRRPWQAHRIVNNTYEIGRTAAARLNELMSSTGVVEPKIQRISAEFIVADAGLLPVPNLHRS